MILNPQTCRSSKSTPVPSQQLAIFLLKRARTMVLLLRVNVLQHGIELTRAHRKGAICAQRRDQYALDSQHLLQMIER